MAYYGRVLHWSSCPSFTISQSRSRSLGKSYGPTHCRPPTCSRNSTVRQTQQPHVDRSANKAKEQPHGEGSHVTLTTTSIRPPGGDHSIIFQPIEHKYHITRTSRALHWSTSAFLPLAVKSKQIDKIPLPWPVFKSTKDEIHQTGRRSTKPEVSRTKWRRGKQRV